MKFQQVLLLGLIALTHVVIVTHHHLVLAIIISVLHLQFSQLRLLLLVLETSLVIGNACPSEVVQFVIMLKTDNMLIILLVFLDEK